MEHQVLGWITQYGYFAIFLLLVCGIVGLPVPDETLLTFAGYLVFKGNLSLPLAFAAATMRSQLAVASLSMRALEKERASNPSTPAP